jgi:hypothetical protein
MFSFGHILQFTSLALEASVLVLMWRRNLQRAFYVFFSYVAYVALQTLFLSSLLSYPRAYFYVYWYLEPVGFLLRILAVHESFMHVFRSFYLVRWFRILLPTTIVLALVISGGRAYLYPAQGSPVAAAIIGAAVTAQYIVLAIAILFFLLVSVFRVPWRIHEYRIILGFGLSALAISFAGSVRSEFGTKFEAVSRMLPGVSYLLALVIWITAVRHPLAPETDFPEQGIAPEALVREVRRQLRVVRALLHRG